MNLFRYLSKIWGGKIICCVCSLHLRQFIEKLGPLRLSSLTLKQTPRIGDLSLLVNVDVVDFDTKVVLIFLDKLTDVDNVEASQILRHWEVDWLLNTLGIASSNQKFAVFFSCCFNMNLHSRKHLVFCYFLSLIHIAHDDVSAVPARLLATCGLTRAHFLLHEVDCIKSRTSTFARVHEVHAWACIVVVLLAVAMKNIIGPLL